MIYQWIGLRENLQETIDFPIKYGVFLYLIQSIEFNQKHGETLGISWDVACWFW